MNKKQVADMFAAEFKDFMAKVYPDTPKDGMQWKERWKTFLAGAMTTVTVVYEDPNAITIVPDVLAELARQITQPGRRN